MTSLAPRSTRLLALLLLLSLLFLGACRQEAEAYDVRGQVAVVEPGGQRLVIDHEAVPGYMEAMRMTLPVLDPTQAAGLAPDDKIRFQLFVQDGRGAIGSIEKLPAETSLTLAPGSDG